MPMLNGDFQPFLKEDGQIPPLVSNLAKDYITGSIDIARVEWNGALELSVFDPRITGMR